MAGRITLMEIQKNNKERVNIYIDEEFAFSTSLSAALGLKKNQVLSDEALASLKHQGDIEKAYQRALHYLGYRARTRQELERYLEQKKLDLDVIETVLNRLEDQGYVDDAAFSQSWVKDRESLNPKSKRALRYELRQKGVQDSLIDEAVADLDEHDAAWRLVHKRLAQWRTLDDLKFRQKLSGYLARRGFHYEIIDEVLQKAKAYLSDEEASL